MNTVIVWMGAGWYAPRQESGEVRLYWCGGDRNQEPDTYTMGLGSPEWMESPDGYEKLRASKPVVDGKTIVAALAAEFSRLHDAMTAARSDGDRRAELTLQIQVEQANAAFYRAMAAHGVDQFGDPIPAEELADILAEAAALDRKTIRAQREYNFHFRGGRYDAPRSLNEKVCDALGLDWNDLQTDRTAADVQFWLFDRCWDGEDDPAKLAAEWREMQRSERAYAERKPVDIAENIAALVKECEDAGL